LFFAIRGGAIVHKTKATFWASELGVMYQQSNLMIRQTSDIKGNKVYEGDVVRVLSINSCVIERLNNNEKKDVLSMMNACFKIDEIDQLGNAWVTKWWVRKNDETESHSLALLPAEMELVKK
jgi:hypothetical protein